MSVRMAQRMLGSHQVLPRLLQSWENIKYKALVGKDRLLLCSRDGLVSPEQWGGDSSGDDLADGSRLGKVSGRCKPRWEAGT